MRRKEVTKARKVVIDGKEYESVRGAARSTGIAYNLLRRVLDKRCFTPHEVVIEDGELVLRYEKRVSIPVQPTEREKTVKKKTNEQQIKEIRDKFTEAQKSEFKEPINNPDKPKRKEVIRPKGFKRDIRAEIEKRDERKKIKDLSGEAYWDSL